MQRKGFFFFPKGSCNRLIAPALLLSVVFATASIASAQVQVTSVSPAIGPLSGGNTVRLLGSGFSSGATVWFWANQAPVVKFVSANEIDVQVPARTVAGPVDVAVFDSATDADRISGGYTYAVSSAPPPTTTPTPTPKPTPGVTPTGAALSSCADLTSPGSYYLTTNVSSPGTCFFIDADNISLNLNGHTITYATGGGSQPTPGVVLADNWYSGYGIARPGSTLKHGNFEIYNGNVVESPSGAQRSAAIWVGQSNDITPAPRIHNVRLMTYTEDSSPIFGTVSAAGWQIYDNNIYYSAKTTSSRQSFYGYAIWIGDQEQAPTTMQDLIHNNYIYTAPQGGIRDTHQNAKIYNNDITFSATYSNDFCVDAPADGQLVTLNNCHPTSGRGVHTNANNVSILANTIKVQELPQNVEYGGCQLGGTYGVQVEFDTSFLSTPPKNVLVSGNEVTAAAAACNSAGLRLTSMTSAGSVHFVANHVVTNNTGGAGKDFGLSFSAVNAPGVPFTYVGNIVQSEHAFVGVDWDGANTFISLGQVWVGTPTYAIDNENGFHDQAEGGPTFSQGLTLQDLLPGTIHCGPYAGGPVNNGSSSLVCN